MKINEINQPKKIDEGRISDLLIGPAASDFFSALFKKEDPRHKRALNIYINDFVGDAKISLDNGVKSGLVDPSLTGPTSLGTPPSQEKNPADVTPEPGTPGSKTAAQRQTSQNINNYVKQTAQAINSTTNKNQKIALTKELVNAMADRQGSPEWNNVVKGIEGIIRRAGTDPNFANAAISNLRTGKTMSEAWRIYFANKLVEAVGLTWKDLRMCVLTENSQYYIADRKYATLNHIFESIVEATDGAQSITEYMIEWFDQYMQGINWRAKQAVVLPAINDIEKTYDKDGGKAAMQKLARLAFSLSGPAGKVPAGARNAVPDTPAPTASNKIDANQVAADLAALSPKERQEVLNKVKAAGK